MSLEMRGLVAEPPKIARYGMKQLYVLDPDGYLICFQWPATESAGKESRVGSPPR